jgi:hypothetical protein
MTVKDGRIPNDINWVDYCDALADESLLEFQKRRWLTNMPILHPGLRDISANAPVPKASAIAIPEL